MTWIPEIVLLPSSCWLQTSLLRGCWERELRAGCLGNSSPPAEVAFWARNPSHSSTAMASVSCLTSWLDEWWKIHPPGVELESAWQRLILSLSCKWSSRGSPRRDHIISNGIQWINLMCLRFVAPLKLLITLESCKEIDTVYYTSKWNLLFWHLTRSARHSCGHRGNQLCCDPLQCKQVPAQEWGQRLPGQKVGHRCCCIRNHCVWSQSSNGHLWYIKEMSCSLCFPSLYCLSPTVLCSVLIFTVKILCPAFVCIFLVVYCSAVWKNPYSVCLFCWISLPVSFSLQLNVLSCTCCVNSVLSI